jgi:glucose/arabinose dehydrogenase
MGIFADRMAELDIQLSSVGVAVGPDGSVYICDEPDQRVYRVSPAGVITTFAGTGEEAFAGDGGLAIDAALARPVDVAVGPDGSVYIADHGNHRIRKVDPDGIITTVAGTGDVDVDGLDGGFSGDGGPAIAAELSEPSSVAVGPDGTVYLVANLRIRKVDPSGTITSLTAHPDDVTDEPGDLGDGVPVRDLAISPADLSVATDGTLYVASGARVLAIGADGSATVVAGTGDIGDRAGEEKTAGDAHLPVVNAIALDPAGNLYLSHADANQGDGGRRRYRAAGRVPMALASSRVGGGRGVGGRCALDPGGAPGWACRAGPRRLIFVGAQSE